MKEKGKLAFILSLEKILQTQFSNSLTHMTSLHSGRNTVHKQEEPLEESIPVRNKEDEEKFYSVVNNDRNFGHRMSRLSIKKNKNIFFSKEEESENEDEFFDIPNAEWEDEDD